MTDVARAKALMMVEDDPAMRTLMEISLTIDPRVALCGQVTSAKEAIKCARQSQPDLIVLDHHLIGEDRGIEAAAKIKEVSPLSIILLFTSHDAVVAAAREPAIDAYLSKRQIQHLLPTVLELLGLPI